MSWFCVCRFSLLLVNFLVLTFGYDLKAFDDTVLFKISWPGKIGVDLLDSQAGAEPYTITTANNEKYQCFIPETAKQEIAQEEVYTGPNPIKFLTLLFNQNTCSYRIEPYWTYELCHGKYVQQYHEERDGKKVKIQKYELGRYDAAQIKKLSAEYDEHAKNPNRKTEIPVKKIDGINMPYVEMEMTDGTMCDLNNKPRSIKVLYVCYQHGKQEIYSIKETATCEYETVVLTPLLCRHPDYKPHDTGENKINCRPLDNAPKKPRSLMALEAESAKLKHQKVTDEKPQKVNVIFRVDKDGQDGQPQVQVEIHPVDSTWKHYNLDDTLNPLIDQGNNLAKSNSVENFLSGHNCLNGGTGWWKYEFCYGRSVTQYHLESSGSKTVVSLGVFNKEKHIEWIDANPNKKPKPIGQRKQLSHFYSHGTICDKTGKPRQTEVKLKCVTNPMGNPSSVSLYLLEPKMCEYVLGVESPLICDILEHADDTYGIISDKILVNLDELKTNLHVEEDDERIANGDE
ncbi:endoplasmic reticulum lectin 1 isoform X1 [Nasonia vitripennis]|uniref:Endoplasmic reticulum lectin 1 n=1 Tax=Nasonia vitripennis TaxID=7425 RepID=A0A7M7Q439_NASVI|nr:endoplasmic reticulum lectin 1 isoform X1 [Nasonia vitripennis]